MVNVNDAVKKNVTDGLVSCLVKLGKLKNYTIDSLVPLLYVLCAHHQGHLLSIVGKDAFNDPFGLKSPQRLQSVRAIDGEESVLLQDLRETVDEKMFEGEAAQIIYDFYGRYNEHINDNYQNLVELVIRYASTNFGKMSGLSVTSPELASLMANLISRQHPTGIYDPCAGMCSYMLSPELRNINFYGIDLDGTIPFMANIRLDAAGVKGYCYPGNALGHDLVNDEAEDEADVLACEPPFGVHLSQEDRGSSAVHTLEDAIIKRFLETEKFRKAVLLVSCGTCRKPANKLLREELCQSNVVDTVIELPANVLSGTGVASTILILNKDKVNHTVKFVLAADCIKTVDSHKRVLDADAVIERLDKAANYVADVQLETLAENDFSLSPRVYIHDNYELLPGQELALISDFATVIHRGRQISMLQDDANVLLPSMMIDNICQHPSTEESVSQERPTARRYDIIAEKCVIFTPTYKQFYIKRDSQPTMVNANYICYHIDESKCTMEYFAQTLVDTVRKVYGEDRLGIMGAINDLRLPVYRNLKSQENIVKRMYLEERNKLQLKLERLNILSGKASDLIHNLGVTFSKVGAGVAALKPFVDDEYIMDIEDNVKFALRQINSTGADFARVKLVMTTTNLVDIISEYLKAWKNFGYTTFEIAHTVELPNDTTIRVDKELLFTLLDNIFINAHQHGFCKKNKEGNLVQVVLKGVMLENEEYAAICISNNGLAMPDNFTLKDFVARGVVGINSVQDGLGGDHICKIAHQFGGKVSIDFAEQPSFNVLLPIYLTSDNSNFEEYELESI